LRFRLGDDVPGDPDRGSERRTPLDWARRTIRCEKDHEIADGYRRWNPPAALPKSRTGWDRLTQRVGREIARLEDRRKNGFGSTATPVRPAMRKHRKPRYLLAGF